MKGKSQFHPYNISMNCIEISISFHQNIGSFTMSKRQTKTLWLAIQAT
jgi:hypothetical protein